MTDPMPTIESIVGYPARPPVTAESVIRDLEENCFRVIPSAPGRPELRAGARVRNYGEQYSAAIFDGTAVVLAVMRRGTDEQPDSWERSWGRPNVEVVVERDEARAALGMPKFTNWADYGTVLALGRES